MGIFLRAGATAYDALAGIATDTYKAMNKPGARMVRSKNQFTKAIGAFWLAMFGVIVPLFLLKCLAGLALTGDPFFAWRH
ncbi:hypothetical protein DOC35_19525 [Salmonella enterica subsp. enterica]|nr:hypothetical protein [Salmonella enterica subsp. enterica]